MYHHRQACCTPGSGRIVHFFNPGPPGVNQRLLSVGTSENTHKTMPYSRSRAGTLRTKKSHLSLLPMLPRSARTRPRSMAVERTYAHFQGQDGLPGWSPGQGGGECIELDVPASITGGRLSVLVIISHMSRHRRVARTGRACVASVQTLLCTAIRERLGVFL